MYCYTESTHIYSKENAILCVVSPVSGVHGQPYAGGAEGVSDGEGSAPKVELVHRDLADLLLAAHHVGAEVVAVHGLDVITIQDEIMLY